MNRRTKINLFLKSLALALVFAALPVSARTASGLGDMPLFFEADSPAQFSARGNDSQFLISPVESRIVLRKNAAETAAVKMRLVGANPSAQILGDGEMPGKINYFTGNDSAQWRSGVPIFSRVRVAGVYPGVNLVYYGNQKRLEYDFNIAPGANPDSILIRFDGADKISVNAQGELVLKVGGGEIRQPAPVVYQMVGGGQKEISGGYKIVDANTIAFAVGDYDRALPLVIDPTIAFSTYFGGTAGETAWSVALNQTDRSIYVAGQTFSKFYTNDTPFSTDGAAFESFAGGKLTGDGFVARFDSTGTNLIYLTYLGGNEDDYVSGIAVDAAGYAFVAGFTDSTNFPTTNAIPFQLAGSTNPTLDHIAGTLNKRVKVFPADAFVAEIDPSGSNLIYSTYLGGSGVDAATGIAIDSSDNAYVTGLTSSTNFPTTNAIPFQLEGSTNLTLNRLAGTENAFVTEIASNGTSLVFSTYLGGTNVGIAEGIAVDPNGFIYVSGFTDSTNFPTINYISNYFYEVIESDLISTNLIDGHLLNGSTNRTDDYDAFVTKITNGLAGPGFVYSTLLGGMNSDIGYRIACDNNGNGGAYVTGYSTSPDFPNTATNVAGLFSNVATNRNRSIVPFRDAFLTKITNDVSGQAAIAYSALFGGRTNNVGYGVAVDASGNAFVTGFTDSTNFPTSDPISFTLAGSTNSMLDNLPGTRNRKTRTFPTDAFVTAFNPDCSALLYSTYLGGTGNDYGYNIAVDSATNVFVVGQTASTNFPTVNAFQDFRNGTNDSFLIEIQP